MHSFLSALLALILVSMISAYVAPAADPSLANQQAANFLYQRQLRADPYDMYVRRMMPMKERRNFEGFDDMNSLMRSIDGIQKPRSLKMYSMANIPLPDYDSYAMNGNINYNNPLSVNIPPADYNTRMNSPLFIEDITPLPDYDETPIYRSKPALPKSQIEEEHRRGPERRVPFELNNYNHAKIEEPKIHSYKEDHPDEPIMYKSTRTHIKEIGVSVLPPPINTNNTSNDVSPFVYRQGPDHSKVKAWAIHMRNHPNLNMDTYRTMRQFDCPICQQFMNQGVEFPADTSQQSSGEMGSHGKRRGDVRKLFDVPEEPLPDEHSKMTTRAKQNYNQKSENEISVSELEIVEILQYDQHYILCRKMDGTTGWLPNFVIN